MWYLRWTCFWMEYHIWQEQRQARDGWTDNLIGKLARVTEEPWASPRSSADTSVTVVIWKG